MTRQFPHPSKPAHGAYDWRLLADMHKPTDRSQDSTGSRLDHHLVVVRQDGISTGRLAWRSTDPAVVVREILRLSRDGLNADDIAATLRIGVAAVEQALDAAPPMGATR